MSLTFKLLSLAIRTLAKPIGNSIKRQAREHEGFRRFAIKQAQRVHQIDMRMRLGILHDADAQQRMHDREQKAAEEKKRKAEVPTVRSEAEQRKFIEQQAKGEKEDEVKKKEEKPPKVKIRPLSEAKAIELGANFFSEAFIFAVAAGLLVWDSWRSRRKESARRDDVAEKLAELEERVERLSTLHGDQIEEIKETVKPERRYSWWNPAGWWTRTEPPDGGAAPAVGETKAIPGSVPISKPEKAIKPTPPPPTKPEAAAALTTASTAAATKAKDQDEQSPKAADPVATPSKDKPERVVTVEASKKER